MNQQIPQDRGDAAQGEVRLAIGGDDDVNRLPAAAAHTESAGRGVQFPAAVSQR